MNRKMKRLLPLCLLALATAQADPLLVKELEELRNSLPPEDAGRQALTLRLADTLFDDAGEISKASDLSASQQSAVTDLRKRALRNYQEALAVSQGKQKLKVEFQLGRLYSDLGMASDAARIWAGLLAQDSLPELKREAALRIAESAEAAGKHSDAERLYGVALELCSGGDICSFARYRRAWALRNQDKLAPAIEEMQQALWDSKGQLREESLRDLIVFFTAAGGDGRSALVLIEALARKISRPQLIVELADSYFSAGNHPAGTQILAFANSRAPEFRHQARLLEQYYAQKDEQKFQETLSALESSASGTPAAPASEDSASEIQKIIHRLTVQLDGERISRPQFTRDFQRVVALHMKSYPKSKERMKMAGGWLAAEKDAPRKMAQLRSWLDEARFGWSVPEIIQLRELRADAAREAKDFAAVAEETKILSELATEPAAKKNYRYSHARALYELKDYAQALPIFRELAQSPVEDKGFKHAVESQNLALDILGQQKDFRAIIAQVASWTGNSQLTASSAANPAMKKEIEDQGAIAEKAEFELAVSLGQTDESLGIFRKFCEEGRLRPQSCDNAKVLAVRLKNQTTLISVLKTQNSAVELAAEYEASGYFSEAAELLELQQKNSPKGRKEVNSFLKTALLYELGGKTAQRDRVLSSALDVVRAKRRFGPEEPAIQDWLRDSGLLSAKHLSLPWSAPERARLADWLELKGQGTPETRKIISASSVSSGKAWDRWVAEKAAELDAAQAKIGFHGARGQSKFEARLSGLKKLVAHVERVLNGAQPPVRAELLERMVRVHRELADEILSSPLPAELSEEQSAGVRQALADMAKPFQEKMTAYEKLAGEQKALAEAFLVSAAAPVAASAEDRSELEATIRSLRVDPSSGESLSVLARAQKHYESIGQSRWSSYFKGRLAQLEKEGSGS